MTVKKIFADTQNLRRARALSLITVPSTPPTTIQPGVPVLVGARPAISLTASGNGVVTQTNPVPGVTSITFSNPGVGLAAGEAVFAFDGTWELAVTGTTTFTASDVEVFAVKATGVLTLTADGANTTHYGWTDYPTSYRKAAGRAAVRIGA